MRNVFTRESKADADRQARIEALRLRVAADEAIIQAERRAANAAHLNRIRSQPRKHKSRMKAAALRRWVGHWQRKIARLNAMAANPGWSK